MTNGEYCKAVGEICELRYDVMDGSDLCYNLLETDQISIHTSVDEAAQRVAMLVQQP